jgi:hypothetical protein
MNKVPNRIREAPEQIFHNPRENFTKHYLSTISPRIRNIDVGLVSLFDVTVTVRLIRCGRGSKVELDMLITGLFHRGRWVHVAIG